MRKQWICRDASGKYNSSICDGATGDDAAERFLQVIQIFHDGVEHLDVEVSEIVPWGTVPVGKKPADVRSPGCEEVGGE